MKMTCCGYINNFSICFFISNRHSAISVIRTSVIRDLREDTLKAYAIFSCLQRRDVAIHLTPTSFSSLSIAYPNCLVVSISAISRSKLVMVFGLVAMTLLELKNICYFSIIQRGENCLSYRTTIHGQFHADVRGHLNRTYGTSDFVNVHNVIAISSN